MKNQKMKDKIRSTAELFAIYPHLGFFDRWKFHRSLKWISSEAGFLELLLAFEKELEKKSSSCGIIFAVLSETLDWYNRENLDERLMDRLIPGRKQELLQVEAIFLKKFHGQLHYFREIYLKIIRASDSFAQPHTEQVGVTPGQFQRAAAQVISNLNFWDIDPRNPNNTPDRMLDYLTIIAKNSSGIEQFTAVYHDMAPVIGLQATSALAAMCDDFQEFESYYHRVVAQIKWWGGEYIHAFEPLQDICELNRVLIFLENLPNDPRIAKCIRYRAGLGYLKHDVMDTYFRKEWPQNMAYDVGIDPLYDRVVHCLARDSLSLIWHNVFDTTNAGMRWEFDQFTEYVPYEISAQDWTEDNPKNRAYWNCQDHITLEMNRFQEALAPRLCALFKKMGLSDFERLLKELPGYLTIQEFTKTVAVPVAWDKDVITQEGYTKGGFYDEEVEVARPRQFAPHTFAFDRPYFQDAIDFLDHAHKLHETI